MFVKKIKEHFGVTSYIYETVIVIEDKEIIIDCHGLTCSDMKKLLDFIFLNTGKYILIFGIGNHSRKPQMDYMNERDWKCPIYRFSVDYLVHKKKGATLQTLPDRIKFRI